MIEKFQIMTVFFFLLIWHIAEKEKRSMNFFEATCRYLQTFSVAKINVFVI